MGCNWLLYHNSRVFEVNQFIDDHGFDLRDGGGVVRIGGDLPAAAGLHDRLQAQPLRVGVDRNRVSILATVAAELSVYVLQVYVMEMSYSPSPWVWPGCWLGSGF